MKIYTVIIKDPHSDIKLVPFYLKSWAITFAKEEIKRAEKRYKVNAKIQEIESWPYFVYIEHGTSVSVRVQQVRQ